MVKEVSMNLFYISYNDNIIYLPYNYEQVEYEIHEQWTPHM